MRLLGALLLGMVLAAGPLSAQACEDRTWRVFFREDSTTMIPESEETLTDYAKFVQSVWRVEPQQRVKVVGYYSTVDEAPALALARARMIAGRLQSLGLPAAGMDVVAGKPGDSILGLETEGQATQRIVDLPGPSYCGVFWRPLTPNPAAEPQ